MRTYAGGCHCGAVRFEVTAPDAPEVRECNCSICRMSGYLHLTVRRDELRILSGEDRLVEYRFGTGVARHLFCRVCGIKSFYVPRSHPEGYSVNARCLDPETAPSLRIVPFDGAHWEENVASLPPLPDDR